MRQRLHRAGQHPGYERPQEQLAREGGRHGITGHADEGPSFHDPQNRGLARLNRHTMHDDLAQPARDCTGVVLASCRRTGVHDHDVALARGLPHSLRDCLELVTHDIVEHRLPAPLAHEPTDDPGVELDDIACAQLRSRGDQLVSGGDYRNARAAAHLNLGDSGGEHGAYVNRTDGVILRKH